MSTAAVPQSLTPAKFRPGSVALRDTWIPLIHSGQVGRRAIRRTMHGRPVVFSRDGGLLQATEHVPGAGARREASMFTAGTGVYPLIDRYGYGWVWYGDPANASTDLMPHVPTLPEAGMPRHFQQSILFDCSYELVCENLLDLTHADFLHSALTGDALSEHDEITVESTSETVTMTRIAKRRAIPRMQRPMIRGASHQNIRVVTITHVRSGVCVLHGDFNPGMDIRMLHPCNPETAFRSRTPVTFNPRNMPALGRHLFPMVAHMVGRQDNWAMRPQNRTYVQPRPNSDLSSRFDKAGLRYRKVFSELAARQQVGDTSYRDDPGRDVTEELGLLTRA